MSGSKGILSGIKKISEDVKITAASEEDIANLEVLEHDENFEVEELENKKIKELENLEVKEEKNSNKEQSTEEKLVKRSYTLRETTVRKLDELKVFHYPVGTALNDIVDEAIRKLYDEIKK